MAVRGRGIQPIPKKTREGGGPGGVCGSPRAGHSPPSSSCRLPACSRPRQGRPRRVAPCLMEPSPTRSLAPRGRVAAGGGCPHEGV
eukprot:1104463-Prymnesium_polylepis.1